MLFMRKTTALPSAAEALPGRATPIPTAATHFVNGRKLPPPYPAGLEQAVFGLGCFWGAERKFWELGDGIYTTAVGYAGGHTPNPTYEETCSGRTGHTEVVLVVFDPTKISYERLLKTLLLAALVPQVESFRGMTGAKLAALNHGTIRSPIPGREGQIVLNKCRSWAARAWSCAR